MTSALAGTLRSAAFGVLAALGVIAWQVAFMAFFGAEATFQVYAVLCACAFPLAIAPSLRAAVGSLAITVPLGFCVLLLAPDAVSTVLAAAFTIGVARVVTERESASRGSPAGSFVAPKHDWCSPYASMRRSIARGSYPSCASIWRTSATAA